MTVVIKKLSELLFHVQRLKAVPPQKAAILTSAAFAALGPIYFLASNAVAQFLHPTENPLAITVSFLVFGSYGWLQTSAFYILGISFIALAAALVLKIKLKINFGAIVVFLVGVEFILVAGNHVQNPGTIITLSEKIHRDSAIAIVVMSPLACYLLAPSLKSSGHRGLWIYSLIAGTIAVLTIIVGFLIPKVHSSFLGVFERILLLNGQLWGELICLRLIWTTFKPMPTQTALDSSYLKILQIYVNLHSERE